MREAHKTRLHQAEAARHADEEHDLAAYQQWMTPEALEDVLVSAAAEHKTRASFFFRQVRRGSHETTYDVCIDEEGRTSRLGMVDSWNIDPRLVRAAVRIVTPLWRKQGIKIEFTTDPLKPQFPGFSLSWKLA